jgi:hypothetical protein
MVTLYVYIIDNVYMYVRMSMNIYVYKFSSQT